MEPEAAPESCMWRYLLTSFLLQEFSHCIKLVKAKYLIVHPQMLETVLESAKECGIPRSNIAIFDETLIGGSIVPKTGLVKEFRSAREMMASGKAKGQKAPWIDIPESEVDKTRVWVPFSSGTTGLSKGVALSHYNLVAQAEQRLFIDGGLIVRRPPVLSTNFHCLCQPTSSKSPTSPRFRPLRPLTSEAARL